MLSIVGSTSLQGLRVQVGIHLIMKVDSIEAADLRPFYIDCHVYVVRELVIRFKHHVTVNNLSSVDRQWFMQQ